MLLAASPFLIAVVLIALLVLSVDQYFCVPCNEWRVDLSCRERTIRFCPVCLSERRSR